MSDRLSRAIQRIAKSDPDLRGAIEATRNRGDQPGTSGVGTSDAERDRICCDGSVSDDANPGTSTRDPDSGGQDASSGLNSDNPADIGEMGEGSLTGLSDCATGEPVCFDGSDWVPPDGWESPTDPPEDPGYTEGVYYKACVSNCVSGSCIHSGYFQTCGDAHNFIQSKTCGDDVSSCNGSYEYVDACQVSGTCARARISTFTCDTFYNAICDEPPPRANSWPADGCVNLAIINGTLVGSKYDPENDGTYSKPMSEIKLCDDFGNSFYLSPSADGGWKTINATKDAGYLWSSTGQKIAHIDGSEYSDPSI